MNYKFVGNTIATICIQIYNMYNYYNMYNQYNMMNTAGILFLLLFNFIDFHC